MNIQNSISAQNVPNQGLDLAQKEDVYLATSMIVHIY
jgi:hypothetical protein